MPLTTANFQCKFCYEIFNAKSDRFYKCKCGKSKVQPEYGSTSYDREIGYNCERLRDGNDHTYYNESEVLIFDEELNILYSQVKELSKQLGFHIYEDYVYDELENEYLSYISIDYFEFLPNSNNEGNKIEFTAMLGGCFSKPKREDIVRRLKQFIEFLNKVNVKEINLSNRKQLTSDELELEFDRKQLDVYDYTFYF